MGRKGSMGLVQFLHRDWKCLTLVWAWMLRVYGLESKLEA